MSEQNTEIEFPKWKLDAMTRNEFQVNELGVPNGRCGVYMVCVQREKRKDSRKYHAEEIMYIGSSKNVRNRFGHSQHPYHQIKKDFGGANNMIYTKEFFTDDYVRIEKALIKYLKPKYNKNGK